DPASRTWPAPGSLNTAPTSRTAALLPDGDVLVAGGFDSSSNPSASAELYDPASGTWAVTGSLHTGRHDHTATLLPNGKVLVAGGLNVDIVTLAEVYVYETASLARTASIDTACLLATAT